MRPSSLFSSQGVVDAEPEAALRWLMYTWLQRPLLRALHARIASCEAIAVSSRCWRALTGLPLEWHALQQLLEAKLSTEQLVQVVADPEAGIDLLLQLQLVSEEPRHRAQLAQSELAEQSAPPEAPQQLESFASFTTMMSGHL